MPIGMRFRASAGRRFSQSGLGTTPNMAPPSSLIGPAWIACTVHAPMLRVRTCGVLMVNDRSLSPTLVLHPTHPMSAGAPTGGRGDDDPGAAWRPAARDRPSACTRGRARHPEV